MLDCILLLLQLLTLRILLHGILGALNTNIPLLRSKLKGGKCPPLKIP
jgi:hypothetical protein